VGRIVKVSGDKAHPTNFGQLCTKGGGCNAPVTTSGRADRAYARFQSNFVHLISCRAVRLNELCRHVALRRHNKQICGGPASPT